MKIISLAQKYFTKKTKKDSFDAHNSEFIIEGKIELEKSVHKKYDQTNIFNGETLRFQDIIQANPWIQVAVDIWSGSWFYSGKLTEYFDTVYWVEPSATGIEIAKQITKNSHQITWINDFWEKAVEKIVQEHNEPIFFLTSTVLSHLDDTVVSAVCASINQSKVGSVFAFSEVFWKTKHQHLWHIRSQAWWQEQLPWWEIDFFGPQVKYSLLWAKCNKGFSWKKIK
jgi:SAM-dependent methyltransferase